MMERERTPYGVMLYAVYLVFEGLSFRASSRAIQPFTRRSHIAVWNWMQELGSSNKLSRLFKPGRERVKVFAIDETGIQIGRLQAFLFIAYEPFEERILGLYLAWTPNSIAVELFLKDLLRKYGRHPVWTDGADWYALACQSMNLKHRIYHHGSWLWEVTERAVQRLKDRTESFDDTFPCKRYGIKCRFKHIRNWLNVFWLHHQPDYQEFIGQIKQTMGLC
jgi:putative transposase